MKKLAKKKVTTKNIVDSKTTTALGIIKSNNLIRSEMKWIRQVYFEMDLSEFGKLIDESPFILKDVELYRRPLRDDLADKILNLLKTKTSKAS